MDWNFFYSILIANLFHSLAGLLWIFGLKRFAGPLEPAVHAELLRLSVILPVLFGIARALGAPFTQPGFALVRVAEWAEALRQSSVLVQLFFFAFLGGVVLIFLFQELVPLVSMLRRTRLSGEQPDQRLRAAMERVNRSFREAAIISDDTRGLDTGIRIPSKIPLAALHGLFSPILVVSRGLLERLDDAELDGVLAHEAAHLHYGGNIRMFLTWLARALQAFNPLSLVLFRELIEAREVACDALASRATGKPRILADALLKFTEPSSTSPGGSPLNQARQQLRERAESDSIRLRYEALSTEPAATSAPSRLRTWILAFTFGGILWLIS